MAPPVWGSALGLTNRRSGDEADQPPPLLLGEPAPDAVALTVLERPGQARLAAPAGVAVREGRTGLLLGGGEEDVGVDAVARGLVLPHVRRGGVGGEGFHVDPADTFLVHAVAPASCRTRCQPVAAFLAAGRAPSIVAPCR